MKKQTKHARERRNAERDGYSEFFNRHAAIAKGKRCDNCGRKLSGHVSEIAHILPKQIFTSIATNDNAVVYLCSNFTKGSNGCHDQYDKGWEIAKSMRVWNKVMGLYLLIQDDIKEYNFKILQNFE